MLKNNGIERWKSIMKIGNSQLIKNIDNYCINDLGGARAVFGTDIEQTDIIKHNFAEIIVEEIANEKMLNDSLDCSIEINKKLQEYL